MKNWSTTKKVLIAILVLLLIAAIIYQFTNLFGNEKGFFAFGGTLPGTGIGSGGGISAGGTIGVGTGVGVNPGAGQVASRPPQNPSVNFPKATMGRDECKMIKCCKSESCSDCYGERCENKGPCTAMYPYKCDV